MPLHLYIACKAAKDAASMPPIMGRSYVQSGASSLCQHLKLKVSGLKLASLEAEMRARGSERRPLASFHRHSALLRPYCYFLPLLKAAGNLNRWHLRQEQRAIAR